MYEKSSITFLPAIVDTHSELCYQFHPSVPQAMDAIAGGKHSGSRPPRSYSLGLSGFVLIYDGLYSSEREELVGQLAG